MVSAVLPVVAAALAAGVVVVGSAAEAAGVVAPEPDAGRALVPGPGPASAAGSVPVPGPAPVRVPGPVPATWWGWPLTPRPVVLAGFDPPDVVWGAGHRGVDLAAAVDQPVLAPTGGVVSVSGVVVDRGVVVVTTATGLRTTVEPVDGGPPVGTVVSRGDALGHVGAEPGHCAPAACLHWGVRRDDTYLDPLALVGARRVVLLPLRPP